MATRPSRRAGHSFTQTRPRSPQSEVKFSAELLSVKIDAMLAVHEKPDGQMLLNAKRRELK